MNAGNKKKPVEFDTDDASTKLIKKKNSNRKQDKDEMPEVDDKLIGDDLDIKKVRQHSQDKIKRSGTEENNY